MKQNLWQTPILFFSGCDRVGKSTTRKAFAEATNQEYITFDRSFIDNLVYNDIFRGIRLTESELRKVFLRFTNMGILFLIYMSIDNDEINRRCLATEGTKYPDLELDHCKLKFDHYLRQAEKFGYDVIRIDANGKTTEKIVEEIQQQIEYYLN